MGKGDRKTFKGKLFRNSHGNKRPRNKNANITNVHVPKTTSSINKRANTEKGKKGEDFVTEVTSKAYLEYWCFPNPMDQDGDNKEICDLLISFFDTLLIISVKNYDNKGNYERYKRRVIEKSTKQLFGAERKLLQSNREIKTTHPTRGECTLKPSDYQNIHRITINVGEQFEKYELVDNKDNKGCINILNKDTFETITNELDTIADLVEYLNIREQLFIKNPTLRIHCSEKDLLAYYLMNARIFPDECYSDSFENWSKKHTARWDDYLSNKSVLLKKLADEKSYFIDDLVEKDGLPLKNGELFAKELMTLSRFERRNIANNLFEMVSKYQSTENDFSRRHHISENETLFLYIYYPPTAASKEVDEMLGHACELYGYKFKPKRVLYLAATENLRQWKFGLTPFENEELDNLSKKQIEFYENAIRELGWFTSMTATLVEHKEYPDE